MFDRFAFFQVSIEDNKLFDISWHLGVRHHVAPAALEMMSAEAPLSAGGVDHRDEYDSGDRPIAQRPIDGPGHVADDTLGEFPDYIHSAPPGKQIRARA